MLPRNFLHAVHCIGDEDSVSAGLYCWLPDTPSPLPTVPVEGRGRKRKQPPEAASAVAAASPKPLPIARTAAAAATSWHSSSVQRVVAAALIDDGQTAAEAAIKAETLVGVAHRWHKRLRTEASTADAPRSGRPPKTDAAADAAIVEQAKADPFLSNKQIRYKLKLPISSDTVGRRLDAAALPSRFAAKKRHYTDEQRRARLSFANGYKHWTAERWLHNSAINVLDWPPYSPDLNPIENLWPRVHELMDRLCPTTDEAVADAFVECWPELSLDLFTDYAQSMPARIAAVIAANGDATQY